MNWRDEKRIERKALLTMGLAMFLIAVVVASGWYIVFLVNH